MANANNLMGYGMPPALAQELGTVGALTLAAAGNTYATGTKIGANQYVVSCTNGDNTKVLGMPTVGGDTGAGLADNFYVNNAGTDTVVLRCSSGVLISAGGTSATSVINLTVGTTIQMIPISSTLWAGIKGA